MKKLIAIFCKVTHVMKKTSFIVSGDQLAISLMKFLVETNFSLLCQDGCRYHFCTGMS